MKHALRDAGDAAHLPGRETVRTALFPRVAPRLPSHVEALPVSKLPQVKLPLGTQKSGVLAGAMHHRSSGSRMSGMLGSARSFGGEERRRGRGGGGGGRCWTLLMRWRGGIHSSQVVRAPRCSLRGSGVWALPHDVRVTALSRHHVITTCAPSCLERPHGEPSPLSRESRAARRLCSSPCMARASSFRTREGAPAAASAHRPAGRSPA